MKNRDRIGRGFTLLEVLIGVLVLAIALLGLAALFPVIVREQRIARESVLGVSVVRSAEAALVGNVALRSRGTQSAWARYAQLIATDTNKNRWQVSLDSEASNASSKGIYNTSSLSLPYGLNGNLNGRFVIKEEDRLSVSQNLADPALVWDAAVCLADDQVVPGVTGAGATAGVPLPTSLPLRVAVFVRRVDPNIRLAPGETLMTALKRTNVYATAVDTRGYPTLSGTGSYAKPVFMSVTNVLSSRVNGPLDTLVINPTTGPTGISQADLRTMAVQVGQRLVDNAGNIFTVISADGNNVKVEGSVPTSVRQSAVQNTMQVVFTPQIPAAVRVLVIRP